MVRGKSNLLQVFDTNASYVRWEHDYSNDLKSIAAIIPYGSNYEELYHLIFDKDGKVLKHNVESEEKPELLF